MKRSQSTRSASSLAKCGRIQRVKAPTSDRGPYGESHAMRGTSLIKVSQQTEHPILPPDPRDGGRRAPQNARARNRKTILSTPGSIPPLSETTGPFYRAPQMHERPDVDGG